MMAKDSDILLGALQAIASIPSSTNSAVTTSRRLLPEESRREAMARFREADQRERDRERGRRRSPGGQILPIPGAE